MIWSFATDFSRLDRREVFGVKDIVDSECDRQRESRPGPSRVSVRVIVDSSERTNQSINQPDFGQRSRCDECRDAVEDAKHDRRVFWVEHCDDGRDLQCVLRSCDQNPLRHFLPADTGQGMSELLNFSTLVESIQAQRIERPEADRSLPVASATGMNPQEASQAQRATDTVLLSSVEKVCRPPVLQRCGSRRGLLKVKTDVVSENAIGYSVVERVGDNVTFQENLLNS